MVRPPFSINRHRSRGFLPSAGSCLSQAMTYSQKNWAVELTQPRSFFCTSSPSVRALAFSAWRSVITLSSAIRSSTTLRRSRDRSGFSVGSNAPGLCTMPASIAAWRRLSSLALTLK